MKVVVLGGSGHVGTYLIPRLVERGHKVVNVSRGRAKPYRPHSAWAKVEQVALDKETLVADGSYGERVASLGADVVIDMITFDLPTATQLAEALKGKVEHYLFCSTVWVYGYPIGVPSVETEALSPIDEYGTKKDQVEQYLMRLARREGFPATSFRPGHIVGEGWVPINPQGNSNPDVYSAIAAGEPITLPNLGLETLHHVHADDVAQIILCAMDNRSASIGECFNNASAQALTLRGYAEAMYAYFGQTPRLSFVPLEEWARQEGISEADARGTKGHVTHSTCVSIEKARRVLGYNPRYTSLEAIQESVRTLIADGRVKVKNVDKQGSSQ